ncbi:hypothetical protein ACU21_01215 [Actinobaculum suis]|nr:hypothetical protein ACU21_01215 [Actinobaculum suis]OCA93531.1 hypothetical protein ACU20_01700 [Actinobaculum suis]
MTPRNNETNQNDTEISIARLLQNGLRRKWRGPGKLLREVTRNCVATKIQLWVSGKQRQVFVRGRFVSAAGFVPRAFPRQKMRTGA